MSEELAIHASGLVKSYGDVRVLDSLDLRVPRGSVFALLGPNGAGKTTTVRILATLSRPDAGQARVAGFDVVRDRPRVRRSISLTGQFAALDEAQTGEENLRMMGALARLSRTAARRRAAELLEQFGLTAAGRRRVSTYSGGMRRRLDLAASFIVAPRVLFLDEPTAGLDPHGRNEVWESIRALAASGTTVLLTTQYLEEADQLADAISVIAAGRLVAAGSPDELKSLTGGDRIDVVLREAGDLIPAARLLRVRLGAEVSLDHDTRGLSVPVTDRLAALTHIIRSLQDEDITAEDIAVRRPTLDEAFLHLTGQQPADDTASGSPAQPAEVSTP